MNKMVINHLEKLFVTNDSATIVQELEVQHPAAKLLVLASKMQEAEAGDGTNFVVCLAGELLILAEELLKSGLHCSEVIGGYTAASAKALETLGTLVTSTAAPDVFRDPLKLAACISPVIASKQWGNEAIFAARIAEVCPPPRRTARECLPCLWVTANLLCVISTGVCDGNAPESGQFQH